ncbi:probable very-long-chain enoyl-CoA reductase art-1 [Ornithodoros turicata]
MDVEVVLAGSNKSITKLQGVEASTTVTDIKKLVFRARPSLYPDRQSIRSEPRGRSLSDTATLKSIDFKSGGTLYVKDLGPQIGWKTVFLVEYFGPLALYLVTYTRPSLFYGANAATQPVHMVVHIAAGCWTVHYVKRLLETLFVHRFSHGTMPIMNLFKNCSYYWLFGLYIGYYVNHPLYTPPAFGKLQIYGALAAFLFAELGNLSIHVALRNLRPPGTKERRIPKPTANPFTWLFSHVSCPNYTYEVLAWASFSTMTQCLPAALFTMAGFYQMAVWALGKHRNYKKEFPGYPKNRKAIVPFFL